MMKPQTKEHLISAARILTLALAAYLLGIGANLRASEQACNDFIIEHYIDPPVAECRQRCDMIEATKAAQGILPAPMPVGNDSLPFAYHTASS